MRKLYCSIAGLSYPLMVNVSTSHDANISTAVINCEDISVDIGDNISIDLGYQDDHSVIFTGDIKQIERKVPDDTYIVTAQDKLVRAADYFVVSTDPEHPYNFGKNVVAEDLVEQVLALAGLTDFTHGSYSSHFEFGVNNDVEVNLISAFDYCKMIGDIITWHLWCDSDGVIHFENRKPFVMTGDTGQIGDEVDERVDGAEDGTISLFTDLVYSRSEKELRNRVRVFGSSGVSATADSATSFDPIDGTYKQVLPDDFYKSVVCSYVFIENNDIAEDIADYNLNLLNRITTRCSITCEGDPSFSARSILKFNYSPLGLSGNWYVYGCDHNWSKTGYTTLMELRK